MEEKIGFLGMDGVRVLNWGNWVDFCLDFCCGFMMYLGRED